MYLPIMDVVLYLRLGLGRVTFYIYNLAKNKNLYICKPNKNIK